MKCKICNTENNGDAAFCRSCGSKLPKHEVSLMDRYPELALRPTSVRCIKGNSLLWLPVIILGIASILAIVVAVVSISEELSHHGRSVKPGAVALCILSLIVGIVLFLYTRRLYRRTKPIDISSVADYVQTNASPRKYPIIIKDSRFGLFNSSTGKVQIPCTYRHLAWKDRSGVLTATTDTAVFDIDINDHRLK